LNNAEHYSIKITDGPLDVVESTDFVRSDSHGAIVIFDGITRDNTDNRKVLFLEYEAYLPMAEKKLETVAVEMCEKWDVLVSIQHRLGKVEIGESSLIVAVGSQHREKAYQASQYSVNRIKQIVPIWKKEYFVGGEIWIGDADGFRPLEKIN
tara:strand:+ start:21612 stop:22067 length:456 start_codon:yes stop_codon:yes gene_type:complete